EAEEVSRLRGWAVQLLDDAAGGGIEEVHDAGGRAAGRGTHDDVRPGGGDREAELVSDLRQRAEEKPARRVEQVRHSRRTAWLAGRSDGNARAEDGHRGAEARTRGRSGVPERLPEEEEGRRSRLRAEQGKRGGERERGKRARETMPARDQDCKQTSRARPPTFD